MSLRVLVALVAAAAVNATAVEAQRVPMSPEAPMHIELSGGYAYQFGGGASVSGGDVVVPPTDSYGFTLDVPFRELGRIELFWWRQDTRAELTPSGGGMSEVLEMGVEYWQFGGMTEWPRGKITTYGVLTLGATRLVAKGDIVTGDEFRFSGTLGGGVKIAGQSRVGVRLEGRLMIMARNDDSTFFCGTGGCAVGVVGETVAQGLFSVNLFVKLGSPR